MTPARTTTATTIRTTPPAQDAPHPPAPRPGPSPCDRWLAAAPHLPPLRDDAAQVAERLMLLLHYGIDWSDRNWVIGRRHDYWDTVLPSRVRSATYTSADLHHWWSAVATALGVVVRDDAQRLEAATLLCTQPRPVLAVLRERTPALVLRTRIVADAVRTTRRPAGEQQ